MRKEVLIAILIGSIFGLAVTFGIRGSDQLLKDSQLLKNAFRSDSQKEEPTPTPPLTTEPQTEKKSALIINSPNNNDLIDQNKITIKGTTSPNALVTFLYEKEKEIIIISNTDGNFSQEIELIGGANEIKIASFDTEGKETNKIINLVYSTAEI